MAARFAFTNLLQAAGAVIVPSSELASMPRGNLLKPGASVRWRSQSGWTIVTGQNSSIDFNRGGALNAVITAGTYATGALLATAITAALEAADATPVWACDYNVTAANKFTISTAAHAFTILSGSGGSLGESILKCIGFATGSDTGSALTHTAGSVAYQSRHSMDVNQGTSPATFRMSIVSGHNVSASGVVRTVVSDNPLVGQGLNDAPISGSDDVMAGTTTRTFSYSSLLDNQYLRLVIEDVQNSVGYNELGVWFIGNYGQPTVLPAVQYSKDNEHLSEIHFADGGAHHTVARTRRRVHKLLFQLEQRGGLAVADRALFDALDALGIGTNFFTFYDHPDGSVVTVYGYNRVGLHEVYDRGTVWAIQMELAEALG